MNQPSHSDEFEAQSGWRRFWNRGSWWKALLVVAVYYAVYQGLGILSGLVFDGIIDKGDPLSSPLTVFFGLAVPILLAGLATFAFAASLGWAKELFGPQPLGGKGWMWIAVALVLIPVILRVVGTSWSAYSVASILAVLFLGLCVGFTEELVTRGVAVKVLRRGGYTERVVMIVSSVLFALLHSGNVLSGQSPFAVAITVLYTFGFGAMMYLSMRATGRLVWAILLHAATDPTTMLATGGIDAHGAAAGNSTLLAISGLFNFVYIACALVAIAFVKGRATAR